LTEIWVPYGQVEVSFDIKQENLSQILEPNPTKISQEDLEKRLDAVTAEELLILSGSPDTQNLLSSLLSRNKIIKKLLYPKQFGALARRKAQEFAIQAEPFDVENLVDAGIVDGSPASIFKQVKESRRLALFSSSHYDPLFGLSSAASDLISLRNELKAEAFIRSSDELPCTPTRSRASSYATRLLQTCRDVDVIQLIEKTSLGVLDFYYGDPESVHAQTVDFWTKALSIKLQSRAERIIFGSGGFENDRTLSDALSRSFFQVASEVALDGDDSKICLLAECSQGLGSDALFKFATGNYSPASKLDRQSYFDGLEVLISFYRLNRQLELSMLSTLPTYFLNKFDFKPVRGARDAPFSLISQGSRSKILVVPDASRCYFSSD